MKALQRLLKGRAKRAKKICFALQTYFVRHVYLFNAAAEDEEDITRVQDHDGAEMMAHESSRLAPGITKHRPSRAFGLLLSSIPSNYFIEMEKVGVQS